MANEQVGSNVRTDLPPDLVAAAEEFFSAGRRYFEFLRRHYKDRAAGVVWVESEVGELVLYSEVEKYTNAIKAVELHQ